MPALAEEAEAIDAEEAEASYAEETEEAAAADDADIAEDTEAAAADDADIAEDTEAAAADEDADIDDNTEAAAADEDADFDDATEAAAAEEDADMDAATEDTLAPPLFLQIAATTLWTAAFWSVGHFCRARGGKGGRTQGVGLGASLHDARCDNRSELRLMCRCALAGVVDESATGRRDIIDEAWQLQGGISCRCV